MYIMYNYLNKLTENMLFKYDVYITIYYYIKLFHNKSGNYCLTNKTGAMG